MSSSILRLANAPSNTLNLPTNLRASTEATLNKVATVLEAPISHRAMANNKEATNRLGIRNSSSHHRSRGVITRQWNTALLAL